MAAGSRVFRPEPGWESKPALETAKGLFDQHRLEDSCVWRQTPSVVTTPVGLDGVL